MEEALPLFARLVGPDRGGEPRLVPRWLFLRAMGLIYLSVFVSLLFQVHGLIGPKGILPATDYLERLATARGVGALWLAPTVLWAGASDRALDLLVWTGIAASLLLLVNVIPRLALAACVVCFLSFIAAAQAFASYQSDGMLMEAGLASLFLAPSGVRPGLGSHDPPSRLARAMLLWEWFRIYFCSGVVKIASGDPQWRHLTALDHYYEYGPLPTWIGWYVQHLPHAFHAVCAAMVLVVEWVAPWLALAPRKARISAFLLLTPFQLIIIATANYTFLNYLVLVLGFFLLDDRAFSRVLPRRITIPATEPKPLSADEAVRGSFALGIFTWTFLASFAQLPFFEPLLPARLLHPVVMLEPFRVAESYGLFARMTDPRYELELQGSDDGTTWTPYPFRFKPQALDQAPGIYAPYHPRFEWNLWFASLDEDWRENGWLLSAEIKLLQGEPSVLALFRADPFQGKPPRFVRVMRWQYWFTDLATRRSTGAWWRREDKGLFAPELERRDDGTIVGVESP